MNYILDRLSLWLYGPDLNHIAECLETQQRLEGAIVTLEKTLRYGAMNDNGIGFAYKPNDTLVFEKLLEAKELHRKIEDRLKRYSPEQIESARKMI